MQAIHNQSIRQLRKLLEQTQTEFATMIGVSKDAVVSWENGRNPLSESFARRISRVTGVQARSLLKGNGELMAQRHPQSSFTREEFQWHRKTFWGRSLEESVRRQLGPCADALELILRAAGRAGEGGKALPLPAVLDAFEQWCRQTTEDFQLLRHIEAQLEQRKGTLELTKSYAQWRTMAKQDPKMASRFGFKDDPKRADAEGLTLSMETIPIWAPGWDMRRRKA